MGEVVQMADWRKRKPKQDPLGRGKTIDTWDAIPVRSEEDQTGVVEHIAYLLTQSMEVNQSIGRLGTVREREQAAIRAMELTMEADAYAKKNGFGFERRTDDNGRTTGFDIFEYTKG